MWKTPFAYQCLSNWKKRPKSEVRNILFISISNKSVSRKRVLGPHVRGREHTITLHFTSWKHAQPKCSVSRKSPQLGTFFAVLHVSSFSLPSMAISAHQHQRAFSIRLPTCTFLLYDMFAKLLFILALPFQCFHKLYAVKFTLVSVSILGVILRKLCQLYHQYN